MTREAIQCPRCGAGFAVEHTARAAACPECAADLQLVRRAGVLVAEETEAQPWSEGLAAPELGPRLGALPSSCYRQMGALDIAHLMLAGGVGVGAAALLRLTQGHFGPGGPWLAFFLCWAAPVGALAVGLVLLWEARALRRLRTGSFGGRQSFDSGAIPWPTTASRPCASLNTGADPY
ncbi:MAG: hypothetical protein ACUVX9_10730 [Anaerolineae bacterium]